MAIAGEPVERARLAKLLWSDRGPDQARASLRQTFYELRQQLPAEPPLLLVGPDRISIAHASVAIDIEADTPADESDGELLLRDLDRIDPQFDRWLIEQRARLDARSGREESLSSHLRPVDDDGGGNRKPVRKPLPARPGRIMTKRAFAGVGFAVLAGAAGLIALRPHSGDGPERIVMVQPLVTARGDMPARALADGLATAVERDIVGTATPVRIADAPTSTHMQPALILRGDATSRDGRLHANVALVAADNTVIWSGNFERPSEEAGAMIDQLGLQVARELHFAFANGRNALFDRDPEAIRLSLAAGDAVGRDFGEAARYSAQLLARAPLFARGWAEAATNAVEAAEDLPDRARAEADAAAAAGARRARWQSIPIRASLISRSRKAAPVSRAGPSASGSSRVGCSQIPTAPNSMRPAPTILPRSAACRKRLAMHSMLSRSITFCPARSPCSREWIWKWASSTRLGS